MKPEFSDSMRSFQDQFDTRRLADRVRERAFRDSFNDADKNFIEQAMFFFMATTDANGQPQCSYKGGPPGFVRITGPSELVFPFYEGNGLYLTAGNLLETAKVGLLFVNFEKQSRLRVNGVAEIDDSHDMLKQVAAAEIVVRVRVTDIHPNCSRNVHKMAIVEKSHYTPTTDKEGVGKAPWGEKFSDVLPDHMKPEQNP